MKQRGGEDGVEKKERASRNLHWIQKQEVISDLSFTVLNLFHPLASKE